MITADDIDYTVLGREFVAEKATIPSKTINLVQYAMLCAMDNDTLIMALGIIEDKMARDGRRIMEDMK